MVSAPRRGGALRLVLADQLSPSLSALEGLSAEHDIVLMTEVADEARYVPHHPKKIAFLFSAMRHFAAGLEERGVRVHYFRLDDTDGPRSITEALSLAVRQYEPALIVQTECGEYRLDKLLRLWAQSSEIPVEIREDTRFLSSKSDFASWASGRKQFRMEYFYREMRRRYDVLMEPDGKPVGGKWNYDTENRKPLELGLFGPPKPPEIQPDRVTEEVLALVEDRFANHAGALRPFNYGVTQADADRCADAFFRDRLARFGDYQDAMVTGETLLYHSLLSLYMNAGLLEPLSLCRRAEDAYRNGEAPLNAVEGFIRQILGWREYVRGLYWLKMPDYADTNYLNAERPLPDFFWTAETDMSCLHHSIGQTLGEAYAHHIQRLMVIGNFALLSGLEPKAVCAWYLAVYVDAFEWVELPNTHGMALFADGGVMASKPYASSGKYIDRMSDYCGACRYDVKQPTGPDACPFNYLYWNFLERNADVLSGNPRVAMIYKSLSRMTDEKRAAIRASAETFLEKLS